MSYTRKVFSRRGHTFIEILVASAISLFVLALISLVLWQIVRSTARTNTQGTIFQEAVMRGRTLVQDVQQTSAAGLAVHPSDGSSPAYLSVHPLVEVSSRGRPLYANHQLILYRWVPETQELLRVSWEGTVPVPLTSEEPVRLTRSQCETAVSRADGARRLQGRVQRFEVRQPAHPSPNLEVPLEIILEIAEQAVSGRPPEVFVFSRTVTLRSQL